MIKKISFLLVSSFLIVNNLYAQNCWEYEEYEEDPIARIGGSVVISEIYYDTHYSEEIETKYHHFGEYVELFNSSTQDIDLSGWKIADSRTVFTFPQGVIIPSGEILIVTYAGRNVPQDYEAFHDAIENGFENLKGVEKFIEMFPEAADFESKIILQNDFVLYNEQARVELINNHGYRIDGVQYYKTDDSSPIDPENNYQGSLDNKDGGVFNGPVYTNKYERLVAQAEAIAQETGEPVEIIPELDEYLELTYKKAIYLETSANYYDHQDLSDPYEVADATPFSIPYTIILQEPSEALFASPPPLPPSVTLHSFSPSMNYIYSETFDVFNNKVSKSGSYFNGLGKQTISYSWDKENNKVWGTQTLYDNQGRPALQTLSAPSCDGFVTNPGFLNGSFNTYVNTESEYNQLNTINTTDNSFSSLKRYYSDNNSNEELQATTDRPYARSVYDKLNPGNVIKSIGGNQIDGDWKTGYSFTVPATQEMYYVFGKSKFGVPETIETLEEVNTKYFKTVVIDAHGNESVVFTDAEGKTLAAARSGGTQQYEVVSVIGEQGFVDVHIPKNINTINFLTSTSDYTVYDLKTGDPINTSQISGGNVYRIEATPSSTPASTFINTSGNITTSSGAKGVRYNVNYYDYALNYYDDVGHLKQSSQPLGFNVSCLQDGIQEIVNHNMISTYEYNALGQLLETTSPDEGTARFKYRKDGQIRFSQNSKQASIGEVSFTNYDEQGRPKRSGVGMANFNTLNPDTSNVTSGLKDVHDTYYDEPMSGLVNWLNDNNLNPNEYTQTHLAGNVSMTKTEVPNTSITWYSYDPYGRVKWTVQQVYGLGLKTIHYKYDYRGNVKQVIYQKDKPVEKFVHQYTYNANNALVKVETSIDGIMFKEQASYSYYKSGELKRVEIADGLQGTDFVYTLGGRLKSINNPNLNDDIGNDINDVFGMTIDYYSGDYTRSGSPILTTPNGTDRYDGNIKATRWATNGLTTGVQDAYTYTYNSNKWLTGATFGSATANANISASADYKVSNITYDVNGNIESLKRTKDYVSGTNEMDNFTYNYNSGKNQLNHIIDTAPSPSDAEDLETQPAGNYVYNEIGQLITELNTNNPDDAVSYVYNASGLVTEVKKTSNNNPLVKFSYDDKGQRVSKETYTNGVLDFKTFYVRDASGNPMAIYRNNSLTEHPIYGASRVGIHYRQDGTDAYQLSDHLGNVRAVVLQDADDDPIIYEEDFNNVTSVTPWYAPYGEELQIEDQRLKCIIYNNYRGARLNLVLEANKTYQISYKVDRHLIQGHFQALVHKSSIGWVYNSGYLNDSGNYSFTITPPENGTYLLYFRGFNPEYEYNEEFLQPNTFYLDDVEIKDTSVEAIAHTDYYPGGMAMPNRNVVGDYRYDYQGQEKDKETGLNAFELRMYDSRINRWLSPDPAKEFHSPYLAMGNDWVNNIDVKGDTIRRTGREGFLGIFGKKYDVYYDEANQVWNNYSPKNSNIHHTAYSGKLLNSNGSYKGFLGHLTTDLKKLQSNPIGNQLVTEIASGKTTIFIERGSFGFRGRTLSYSPGSGLGGPNVNGSRKRPSFVAFGHELAHAFDIHFDGTPGLNNTGNWFPYSNGKFEGNEEIFAGNVENLIRSEHGLPQRQFYGVDGTKNVGRYNTNLHNSIHSIHNSSLY